MPSSAPRLLPRLVAAVDRLDDGRMPIAELCRRAGSVAEQLGTARPSYESIRRLAREGRRSPPTGLRLDVRLGFRLLAAVDARLPHAVDVHRRRSK